MALETAIRSSFGQAGQRRALVLMGGGARAAYQAGVLLALAQILRRHRLEPERFPFDILIGTSAGSINAAFLASRAAWGVAAFEQLAEYWARLHTEQVFALHEAEGWSGWIAGTRLGGAIHSVRMARSHGSLVDSSPLRKTLERGIGFRSIAANIAAGHLHAVAVTAFSYSTGLHWTFCESPPGPEQILWSRPGRIARRELLTADHLLASSAIPYVFPPVALAIDDIQQYFGDGSMRQTSPLSPALKLGADRIMVIGVGQPVGATSTQTDAGPPGISEVGAHVIGSVFHDTLHADVEQTMRISETLSQLPREVAQALGYRPVRVLSVHPRSSLDQLARQHLMAMPEPVREALAPWLGETGAAALGSYLLFEPAFTQALIEVGQNEALAREQDWIELFTESRA